MRCPKCQSEINENAKFCVKCGCRLEQAAPPPAPQGSLTCPKCGSALKAGTKFCVKCGTPVGTNEAEESTWFLYGSEENGNNNDRTVILDTGNAPGMPVQTSPRQVPPVQNVIVPPVQEVQAKEKKEKKEKSGTGLVIVAAILGIVTVLGIGAVAMYMIFQNDTGKGVKKASVESETEEETKASKKREKKEDNPLQEMLENRQYTELIDTLLGMEDVEFYGDEENMREYMRQALVGHMNTAMNEAEELAASGDFDGAYGKIDNELAYRNNLKGQGRVHPLTEDSSELEEKREQINSQYVDYIYQNTQQKAEQRDQSGMEALLQQASGRLSGEEYNRISIEAYYTFVIKKVDQMQADGNDPYVIMNFIDSYFEKTNYHGYLMEMWDNQNAQSGRVSTWSTSITHADANGYLLYNSNGRYINKSELGRFSEYELYLARWEIYARHNRIFVDSALNTYFSKYGWYNGNANYASFDESILNEYEKGNIRTIIEYEKECGYR